MHTVAHKNAWSISRITLLWFISKLQCDPVFAAISFEKLADVSQSFLINFVITISFCLDLPSLLGSCCVVDMYILLWCTEEHSGTYPNNGRIVIDEICAVMAVGSFHGIIVENSTLQPICI